MDRKGRVRKLERTTGHIVFACVCQRYFRFALAKC